MSKVHHSAELVADSPNVVPFVEKLRGVYHLTKPGITRMVVLTTSAGYFLAIPNFSTIQSLSEQIVHFVLTIIGTTLTCAGSCVLNNYIERDHDKLMKRTMSRVVANGSVNPLTVLVIGLLLCSIGLFALAAINTLTVLLALCTIVSYVVIYTPLKRVTTLSLLIGAIPGALPPLGGWTAVTNNINSTALVLFGILFIWQLPHFLALSWMYRKDYERGGFKMTAVTDENGKSVALQSIMYCVLLLVTAPLLTFTQATGFIYLVVSSILGFVFLYFAIKFFKERSHERARNVLLSSYAYLTGVIMVMFLDKQ